MSKINDEMKRVLENSIWVLATADKQGIPNAVPIHWGKVLRDDKLMMVNNFMKKTLDNISVNPNVSVSVWKEKTGFQFKGKASVETSGSNFEAGRAMVLEANPKANPKGVVIVDLQAIYLTTPGADAGKKVD
jgi:hypothetical protein